MNGLFNNNFLFGFLLSKDLPRQEQLMVGLSAGQSREPMAVALLQPLINRTSDESTKRVAAEKRAQILASPIEIELPQATAEVQIRLPATPEAKFVKKAGPADVTDTGEVKFTADKGELTLGIVVDDVERPVTVLRGPR